MTSLDVAIPTADGTAAATLHVPEGTGPWPAAILYPDVAGLRPTFSRMGERLASYGYVVLVPDLYHRSAPWEPFDAATVFGDEPERARMYALAGSVGPDEWAADTGSFIDFLEARPEVIAGPIGTTGYCYGGRVSLTIAGRLGERIGAAASFHGGGLATDDPKSPHLLAPEVRAQVYVGGARDDGSFDAEAAERLAAAYTEAGVTFTIEQYDALHGFAVPDNGTYDPAAEERHWSALSAFYDAALTAG